MKLYPYSKQWKTIYDEEASTIRNTIGTNFTEMQHIGSTAILGIKSKPIIDIAIMLPSLHDADNLILPLANISYVYDKPSSSSERFFFRKGKPVKFHLSLTAPNVTFWRRQILFRDYLNSHQSVAKEYEELKMKMIEEDPGGGESYLNTKSSFVEKVLRLAEKDNAK
jgi:GrpB-like predicted nucleotidyltransferase (UPF0157 family)